MKKRFTGILAALALLVGLTIPLGMWGQDYTITFANSANGATQIASTTNASTVIADDGSRTYVIAKPFTVNSGNSYYGGSNTIDKSSIRMGKSGNSASLTISLSEDGQKRATSIVVNCCQFNASNAGSLSVNSMTAQNVPSSADDLIFTFESATDITNLVLSVTKATYVCSITVNYTTGGSTPTCATPTFSPEDGTYTQAQNVTIGCETEGATIYYTTDGNNPTTSSTVYSGAINVSTNTTIKAMAAAEGYNNSAVATAAYTIVNIEHAGTEADPYTVADARTAIDANVGTQDVYVSGTVSRRYNNTVSNGKLSYYISDDGTQTNELEAYKGLYLNGAEFTSYEQIQAGDVVVIYGDLTKFNSTYELAEGNYLVSHTPGTTPSISADNVTLAYDATSGEIDYTITNPASGVTLTATTPASWISNLNVNATSSKVTFPTTANEGTEDRTATVTLSYTGATDKTVTVTQKHYVADYATLPFEFDDNATAVANTDGLTQNGLDSYPSSPKLQFNTTGDWLILHFNERPGTLSFNIKGNSFSGGTFKVQTSEDGTTYTDLATYTELSGTAQTEEFNNLGENVRYIKWIYTNKSSGNVALGAITLAQYSVPVTGDKYVKVTSTTDLTSGQYLIVYEEGSVAFNGGLETLDATNNTIAVTISNNEIAVANATAAAEFTIDVTNGTLKSASGKYIGVSSNSNGLKQTDNASTYTNSFSIDGSGNAIIAAVFEGSTMTMRYNSASNQNRFRYYSSGQQSIQLYKKEEATPAGPSITVNGYGNTDGGYVLLAWPENISPANIEGMISDDYGAQLTPETPGTYDLYYYDESQEKEWRNYRTNSFNLVPGKGYLYASKEGVTLTYEGEANPDFDDVDNLPYTENDLVKSIYLAGNSKTNEQTFYVYNSGLAKQTFNYLTMNEDGDGFISGQGAAYTAPAMTGFFVQAPGAGMTLSTENLEDVVNVSSLNINVLRDRGSVIDNAIVSFSNGSMMDKFYLKNNTTRVYIPQGNREMAIANSAAEAEMPVSFRASENGTYTLAVEAENVEMNYLHLIDNLTGMDVDLLQTPSYTFEAKTSDYASRFRLVFKANGTNENNAETFAYFNGSSWTISNVGEATLQVVDVTGRTVANQLINGNAELNLNQPAGVYVIRLVNGDNVKTQKVVVR